MKLVSAVVVASALLAFASAQSSTLYRVELLGANQSPAVDTNASAVATISFNTDSNNITYYLDFDAIPQPIAAHIHVNAGPGENGSVAIPLWQATFAPVPNGAPVTGRVASNTQVTDAFVGPLEVLPFYNNVPVSQVLSQYVQTGEAYVQVHTQQFTKGFIRGNFAESDIVDDVVTPQSAPVLTVPETSSS